MSFLQKITGGLKFEEKERSQELKPLSEKERSPEKIEKKLKSDGLTTAKEGQLAIDLYETDSEIIIESAIAGVNPADLDIEITSGVVTIRGKREKEIIGEPQNYYYRECFWGPFSRSVVLPTEIDPDKSRATFKNGILTIRLPVFEKTKTKKLEIKTGD